MLADIKAKHTEGVALGNDVTRYELQLSNLELTYTQIRNVITILNNNLVTILGLPNGTSVEPDTTLVSRFMPLDDVGYWTGQALRHSLPLRQSKQQEQVTRSDLLPKIAFFASNHFDGPITIEVPPIDKNFNYWYVGVGIKYNIASLYKSNKSLKRSRLATHRALQQYDDVKEQMELAVKADHVRYVEAHEQLHAQIKNVELANQNYVIVNNRYKNDMALITVCSTRVQPSYRQNSSW